MDCAATEETSRRMKKSFERIGEKGNLGFKVAKENLI